MVRLGELEGVELQVTEELYYFPGLRGCSNNVMPGRPSGRLAAADSRMLARRPQPPTGGCWPAGWQPMAGGPMTLGSANIWPLAANRPANIMIGVQSGRRLPTNIWLSAASL
jgi:hypothetical protein